MIHVLPIKTILSYELLHPRMITGFHTHQVPRLVEHRATAIEWTQWDTYSISDICNVHE